MGKKLLPPAVALLGGAVGFGLRKWQLADGFEAETALPVPGAPCAIALAVFSGAVALVLLALCRKQIGQSKLSWETAFAAGRQNTVFVTALLLSALLLLGSAGLELMEYAGKGFFAAAGENWAARIASAALPPLRILLCLGSLPAVFLWARALFRGEGGKESLSVLTLCMLYCVWLISDYQLRAADPVVMDYVYEVFAIVTALLGLYYIAGHAFGNGRPRRTAFFCLLGTYFSLVTLADVHPVSDTLRYGFAALYLTAHAVVILNHPPVEEAPAEAEREADENA